MADPAHHREPELAAVVVAADAQVDMPVRQIFVVETGVVGNQQLKGVALFVLVKKHGAVLLISLCGRGQSADEEGGPVYGHFLRPVHQDMDAQLQKHTLNGAALFIHKIALVISRAVIDGGNLCQLAAQSQNHIQIIVVRIDHVARYRN